MMSHGSYSMRVTKEAGRRTLWVSTFQRAGAWDKILEACKLLAGHIKFGIWDIPSLPFTDGRVLTSIPQTPEDKEFSSEDM